MAVIVDTRPASRWITTRLAEAAGAATNSGQLAVGAATDSD
jgi:hypothetical protein